MKKIINNKIQCNKCGDIIESKTTHDFKYCSCKSVAVDGGKEYLKRLGNKEDFIELSE
jgi:Zn finger protein HypA/HybF involved in hydrogenase expression